MVGREEACVASLISLRGLLMGALAGLPGKVLHRQLRPFLAKDDMGLSAFQVVRVVSLDHSDARAHILGQRHHIDFRIKEFEGRVGVPQRILGPILAPDILQPPFRLQHLSENLVVVARRLAILVDEYIVIWAGVNAVFAANSFPSLEPVPDGIEVPFNFFESASIVYDGYGRIVRDKGKRVVTADRQPAG